MNLNSLKYFMEVAETKSFTKASKRLFVSQPGISQQIDSLEKQLGVTLLLRTTRAVELTEEGRYLYKQIRSSFNDIESTVSNLMKATAFPGLLNIATIPSAASLYVPLVLEGVRDLQLDIEFLLKETTSSEVIELVEDGSYHLGFIRVRENFQHFSGRNLDYITFKEYPIRALVSTNHPLANRTKIKLVELKNDYFIHHNRSDSNTLSNQLKEMCHKAGFKPKILMSGPELLTISNIVSKNLAVALLPENMYNIVPNKQIRAIELEDVYIENSIAAIWKDDGYINPNLKLLINILHTIKRKSKHRTLSIQYH